MSKKRYYNYDNNEESTIENADEEVTVESTENNTEEKDTTEEATTEKEKVVTESIVSDYNTVSKEESVVDTKKANCNNFDLKTL